MCQITSLLKKQYSRSSKAEAIHTWNRINKFSGKSGKIAKVFLLIWYFDLQQPRTIKSKAHSITTCSKGFSSKGFNPVPNCVCCASKCLYYTLLCLYVYITQHCFWKIFFDDLFCAIYHLNPPSILQTTVI